MEAVQLLATAVEWGIRFYFWLHIAAFILSWVAPDPNNPLVRFIQAYTLPLWDWAGRISPRVLRPLAAYLALMTVLFGEIVLPGLIRSLGAFLLGELAVQASLFNLLIYLGFAGFKVLGHLAWFFFFLSILWFGLGLVGPSLNNPILRSLYVVLDPFLTPLQRFLPRAKIDLSPLVLALACYLASHYLALAAYRLSQLRVI